MQDEDTLVFTNSSRFNTLVENDRSEKSNEDYDDYARTVAAEVLAAFDIGLNVAPAPSEFDVRSLLFGRPIRADLERLLATYRPPRPIYVALGYTSGDLLALACDTQEALDFVCNALEDRGIPRWAISPGLDGYGAGLLLLRSRDRYIPRQVVTLENGGTIDVCSSDRCILLPPYIDEHGEVYRWLYKEGNAPPAVQLSDLAWFGISPNPRSMETDPWKKMPPRIRAFFTSRVPPRQAESRLFAVAYEARAWDIPRSDAREKLLSGAQLNELSERVVDRAIASAYSRTCQKASALAATNIERAYAWIEQHAWPARYTRARIVAYALLRLYAHAQNGVLAASYLQLEELTRYHPETIKRALQYLQEVGFIEKLRRKGWRRASRWRLGPEVLKTAPDPGSRERTRAEVLLWDTDARERTALGDNGLLVYYELLLLARPASPQELAARCKLTVGQVVYSLKKKLSCGPNSLVRQTEEGWIVVKRPSSRAELLPWLDENVAGPRGARGMGEARREVRERRRSRWILWPIERALYRQMRRRRGGRRFLQGERATWQNRRAPYPKRLRAAPVRSKSEAKKHRKQVHTRTLRLVEFFRTQGRRSRRAR